MPIQTTPMARNLEENQEIEGASSGPPSPPDPNKPPPQPGPGLSNGRPRLDLNISQDVNESTDISLPDPAAGGFQEEAMEASVLFREFVQDEIRREHLEVGEEVVRHLQQLPNQAPGTPTDEADGHVRERLNATWVCAGRELRQLADAFSRSRERQRLKERAQNVSIQTLDQRSFIAMLRELFDGEGITTERVLILFFFCADVAIEAVRHGWIACFFKLTKWAVTFIATSVASWVHRQGGWAVVLRSSLDWISQLAVSALLIVAIAVGVTYVRRNWR